MTNKSLNDKWLDAQAHPENYSDEELDELLFSQADDAAGDGNALGVSDEMILLKRAYAYDEAKRKADEAMEEANEMKCKADGEAKKLHPWMKIAAAFVGLLMLSGISYAAFHIASHHAEDEKVVAVADSVKTSATTKEKTIADKDWNKIEPTKTAPVVFEDAELSTILKYIADKTNVKVEYRNPSAAHIRFYLQWDGKDSLQDIIDKLNHFEKVHVTFDEAAQLLIVE